jgi:glycosyltransferase involved in cell wall biosynthesis
MSSSLRIAIDARAASHPQPGGFKTYAEGLIAGLAALDSRHRFLLCVDRPYWPVADLPREFRLQVIPSGPKLLGAGFREQAALPLRLAQAGVDVAHFLYNTSPLWAPGRRVVTIHDLILLRPPAAAGGSLHRRLMNAYFRLFLLWSASTAHAIVTDSRFSAAEIAARFPQAAGKVQAIPLAASAIFQPGNQAEAVRCVAAEFGLGPDYVLAAGSADPRKNTLVAVQAYALLPGALRQRHRLVIVLAHPSRQPELERRCQELGVGAETAFVVGPPGASLQRLYSAAAAFLFPSLYEGFGMPPLEAMACGTPVVASSATAIPEVVGEAGLLVEPRDPRAMAEALQAVLSRPGLAAELREQGLRRAGEFSWAETARQTVAVYQEASGLPATAG